MSFQSFSLDPRILAGIAAVGYTEPTPIQQRAIPTLLQGSDVVGVAQTGTGKTAAFVLPILERLIDGPRGSVRALIIVPTITTTTAPITLCQRKAISRVHGENATVSTTAMPAMRPQNAPAAVARLTSVARMNTPSSDP